MKALFMRGDVDEATTAKLLEAAPAEEGTRYAKAIFVIGEGAGPEDAVMGLKEALGALERKPPGRLLVVVSPDVIEDTALAAFAAAKSLARETALPPHCVNALWLKQGALPGWRAPVDLWKEAAGLASAILSLESTSGQVFVVGPSPTAVPH